MTKIHPTSDATVVQMSNDEDEFEDGHQVRKHQHSAASNRDDDDESIDNEQQTYRPNNNRSASSKSDELNDERIDVENSNQLEKTNLANTKDAINVPSNNAIDNVTDHVNENTADNVTNHTTDNQTENSTDTPAKDALNRITDEINENATDNPTNNPIDTITSESSTNRVSSPKRSTSSTSSTKRISTSGSSRSSHSSSTSSSTDEEHEDKHDNQDDKANKLLDRGQTIFKPILNGLTNSNLFKPKLQDQEHDEQEKFTFTWSDLSYFVYTSTRFGMRKKRNSSSPKSMFGLLGPSGAGKSSLLDCLSFKRLKNVSGDIKINGKHNKYKMAYIPQHDEYFEDLTCLEILTYASRLKNNKASVEDTLLTLNKEVIEKQKKISSRFQTFHHRVARNVLDLLGLTEQTTKYAGRLSGGQKKRLSIAQELVIKPDIVFLDEPTSGLDSNSSFQCISLLSQLAKQSTPIAIVATIHQPNPKTLELFDQIYVLSKHGQVIYNASPSDVVSHLRQENINVPIHYNPADYLLEIASDEYDPSYIERMVQQVKRLELNHSQRQALFGLDSKDASKAFEMRKSEKFYPQFQTLFSRCFLLTIRNPMLTTNRILSHLLMAVFIGWVFGPDVGKQADCPPKISLVIDAEEMSKLANYTIESSKNVMDNMSSIFFGIIVMLLGSLLPTLVTFPLEVKILQKETHNGWYGVKPYFYARLIADLPLQILVPFSYVSITYVLNGQLMEEFRFVNYSLIFVLTAVIAQCHGIIVSAIFSKDIMTAVYLGPITALPLLLFSGFLVRIERMPWIMRPFTYLSYMRFAFEGIVISIYGFNRYGDEAVEQISRVRKQLDTYFTNLMGFVTAGINCEEDWDKANLRMNDDNMTSSITRSNLFLDLNSLKDSITMDTERIGQMANLMEAPSIPSSQQDNNTTENGLSTMFNNMLDLLFNSQLDENGKIVPRVMQLFNLKDAFLYHVSFPIT